MCRRRSTRPRAAVSGPAASKPRTSAPRRCRHSTPCSWGTTRRPASSRSRPATAEDRMSLEQALESAARYSRRDQEEFFEELRIPSVSTLPTHAKDVRRNADWLRQRFDRMGFRTTLTDVEGGRHPVLEAEWKGRERAPLLTVYGQYDVQPPDPLKE